MSKIIYLPIFILVGAKKYTNQLIEAFLNMSIKKWPYVLATLYRQHTESVYIIVKLIIMQKPFVPLFVRQHFLFNVPQHLILKTLKAMVVTRLLENNNIHSVIGFGPL